MPSKPRKPMTRLAIPGAPVHARMDDRRQRVRVQAADFQARLTCLEATPDRVLFAWAGGSERVTAFDVLTLQRAGPIVRPGQLSALIADPGEAPSTRLLAHVLLGAIAQVPRRLQLRLVEDRRQPAALRASAIGQLSLTKARSTIPARSLVRMVTREGLGPSELRMEAAYRLRALKRLSRADVKRLATWVARDAAEPPLRDMVIETLGELGERRVRDVLSGLLEAPRASTRLWGAFALACLGPGGRGPLIGQRLVGLLDDDTPVAPFGTVAEEARHALTRLGYLV